MANATEYGLAAGIWSRNYQRAEQLAARLRAGTVWINDWHVFDEFGPFGGYRQSGIGRELGRPGLESYTEIKHVHAGTEGEAAARKGHRALLPMARPLGYEHAPTTRIISGPGAITRLAGELSGRILLVTDAGVNAAGIVARLLHVGGDRIVAIFDAVPQDSGLTVVDAAAAAGRLASVDTVLCVGGGSVLDTGKAVALSLGIGIPAAELLGMNHLAGKRLTLIAVPTTAGTGSEVTGIIVLKDERFNRKVFIADPMAAPDLAILDPTLTLTLPAPLTAGTAMDALTHAIEAYTSTMANPVSDAFALHAIELIQTNLERVIADGSDLAARSAMQSAANLAGSAINIARVGLVHAASHALGALHGVSHGTGNGIMLPHVIRWNALVPEAAKRYRQVARALGADSCKKENTGTAEDAARRITELLTASGHPLSLAELGISDFDPDLSAALTIADFSSLTNLRPVVSVREIADIFRAAWSMP